VDGHNAFVHPLKFDELLIKVIFFRFYNLKFHVLSRDEKKILISSKSEHSSFMLSTVDDNNNNKNSNNTNNAAASFGSCWRKYAPLNYCTVKV